MEQWKYENLTIDERWKLNELYDLSENILDPKFAKQPNEIEYLIEDFIDQGSINIIYGQPKKGKSLFVNDLIVSLGQDLIGPDAVRRYHTWMNRKTAAHVMVWFMAYEDPLGAERRIQLAFQKKKRTYRTGWFDVEFFKTPPDIFKKSFLDSLDYSFYEIGDYKHQVLVIDTLEMAMALGLLGDENSSSTMAVVIDQLRKISDLGCTIFVVHHSGKDISRGLRGHNSLEAAADSIFLVDKKIGSNIVTVKRTHYRNGTGGEQFKFEIKTGILERDPSFLIPYLEPLEEYKVHNPGAKLSLKEVSVLNLVGELIEKDPANVRIAFGLDNDLLAVQLAQLEASFIAANIAPQAKTKASQARALKRTLESLGEKGLINERDGFYWLPENGQTNDYNQT